MKSTSSITDKKKKRGGRTNREWWEYCMRQAGRSDSDAMFGKWRKMRRSRDIHELPISKRAVRLDVRR